MQCVHSKHRNLELSTSRTAGVPGVTGFRDSALTRADSTRFNCVSEQQLSSPLSPSGNSIVQANITNIGDVAVVSAPHEPVQPTLPDQTPVAMLSRLRYISEFSWSTLSTGVIFFGDIEEMLRTNAEHNPLLTQYELYRSDFKLLVRINSNQFYSGALLVSWWPVDNQYAATTTQRAVLHPVTISAATQQSAEITIPYCFPQEWLSTLGRTSSGDTLFLSQKLWICIEVLAPLRANSPTLSDNITVQLFGSYVSPRLQFNRDASVVPPLRMAPGVEKQSKMEITRKNGDTTMKSSIAPSPAVDASKRADGKIPSYKESAPTLSSIPIVGDVVGAFFDVIKLATGTIASLTPSITALAPLAPLLLDKPENASDTIRALSTIDSDNHASDVVDVSSSATYSKFNYLKSYSGAGVDLGTWTLAQYASLPGLHSTGSLSGPVSTTYTNLPIKNTTTPLGYLQTCFQFWRGSIKLKIQFFCSAFVSTRVAIAMVPILDTFPVSVNDDDYIVQFIEIKGDTTAHITVPFTYQHIWSGYGPGAPYKLGFRFVSPIVGFDTVTDPVIDYAIWMAGGPDTQFSCVNPRSFTNPVVNSLPVTSSPIIQKTSLLYGKPKLPKNVETQSSIKDDFSTSFPAIVDGCNYQLDNGFTTSDCPVTFNDLFKRYYCVASPTTFTEIAPEVSLTRDIVPGLRRFTTCFAVIRGGYRAKFRYNKEDMHDSSHAAPYTSFSAVSSDPKGYVLPSDSGWYAISVPWDQAFPFVIKNKLPNQLIGMTRVQNIVTPTGPAVYRDILLSLRDDVETGMPVLPSSIIV